MTRRDTQKAYPSGHRPSAGYLMFGPRVTVTHGAITRTMTQMLCDKCGKPVSFRQGAHNGRWVHGEEK